MKTNYQKLCFSFLILFSCLSLQAQHFDSTLIKLDRGYKQEKLYLQFDRSIYSPGETIWFKAYLFAGNFPSEISKTFYAELVDINGKVLSRKTSPVLASSSAASFEIPADYRNSVVYVRAYTKWMLNFDSSYLFSKAITIAAPPQRNLPTKSQSSVSGKSTQVITSPPAFYLQFFPEGGDLADGIESRVAFKATDRNGMPVKVTGDIVDRSGKKVTSFNSTHDGMGSFTIQPSIGEQYRALWKDQFAKMHESALPPSKANRLVLEVNNFSSQVEFKIKRSAVNPPYPFVYVVAQMNQQLLYRAKANITKAMSASSMIPVENLPAGIMQITVFSPDEKPIAERIVFINQSNYSFITDLNTAIKDLSKKKKNVIQIDVPDTLACNLSVSVTDADINSLTEEDNIFSHVLLSSDIKGYVHDPAYYFSSDADSLADHLDLVMMTNGWRRFKWEDALAGHFPPLRYLPENYISIEGQVHGLNRTLLADREINSIIELKNKNRQFLNIPVQPDGKFVMAGLVYYDTAKIYYQFNNDKNKTLTTRASFDISSNLLKDNLHLKPDSTLFLSLRKPDSTVIQKNIDIYREELTEAELQKVKTLKTVVVTTRQKSKQEIMDEEYASGFFSGGDSRIILPEDDPAFLSSQNLLSYLQGRVAGLQVNLNGTDASLTWRGSPTSLFVNEVSQQSLGSTGQITQDASYILTLPMSDIAMVKIFSPPFFGATGGGAGGAVAVYLKKGASGNQMTKGLDYVTISGYSPAKEFYSPDYSKEIFSDIPDLRKTLYWNPFVLTDKNHRRILLPFYNNEMTKKMKVIIEGCNEDGKLTRVEKILQ